ncbi:hypothetical protein DH2020_002852 [Rehmannia glutinosa]|uniref:Pentatricopeptide repeat-containing protein n=1 Tax=Rehmannia glutinosa TaxID=99300 RepID=A0ABR0XUX3_REHGL
MGIFFFSFTFHNHRQKNSDSQAPSSSQSAKRSFTLSTAAGGFWSASGYCDGDPVLDVDIMKGFSRESVHLLSMESLPSTLQLISPIQQLKVTACRADTPTENAATLREFPRKSKYISHEAAIDLIRREKNPEHALEIFNKVSIQKGFQHNNSTYAIILHKLAQYKKYQSLDAVLHQMTYETCKFHEGIFLNLMKHFSKSSMHERVLEMFYFIRPIARANPSLKAISTCLNILVDANQIDLARTFLLSTRKDFHLQPNTCIFNILVKHHCKKGDLESAFEVVKEMEKSEMSCPNLITYSTLIDGLCGNGRLEESINLFEEMVSKHQIVPDALTYNLLINGFCRGGKTDRARKIMDFMKKNGCNPNAFNYSSLMNGLCRDGKFEEAKEIFIEMKGVGLTPDTVIYTTLINCLCRAGRTDEAIELLKEMKENDCRADEGFSAPFSHVPNELLVSLCEAGNANDAATLLFGLVEMGFKPEPFTWSIVIDLVFTERKLLPAFELLDKLLMKDLCLP